jgi:hypothetical protein
MVDINPFLVPVNKTFWRRHHLIVDVTKVVQRDTTVKQANYEIKSSQLINIYFASSKCNYQKKDKEK